MSVERTFVDTNVLLYAYDTEAGVRHERAAAALRELWEARAGVVSTQVLQEFAVNARRRMKASSVAIARVIGAYRAWDVHRIEVEDVLGALTTSEANTISYWDALVVVSAARAGASRLYTEDLNDGQMISGVRIVNPLVDRHG